MGKHQSYFHLVSLVLLVLVLVSSLACLSVLSGVMCAEVETMSVAEASHLFDYGRAGAEAGARARALQQGRIGTIGNGQSRPGLYFQNTLNIGVSVAVSYFERDGSQVVTGWFNVRPRQTIQVYNGPINNRAFFFFGQSPTTLWSGTSPFFIHPRVSFSYTLPISTSDAISSGFILQLFRRLDPGSSENFTVVLSR